MRPLSVSLAQELIEVLDDIDRRLLDAPVGDVLDRRVRNSDRLADLFPLALARGKTLKHPIEGLVVSARK